jgi:hypothetical protein
MADEPANGALPEVTWPAVPRVWMRPFEPPMCSRASAWSKLSKFFKYTTWPAHQNVFKPLSNKIFFKFSKLGSSFSPRHG